MKIQTPFLFYAKFSCSPGPNGLSFFETDGHLDPGTFSDPAYDRQYDGLVP